MQRLVGRGSLLLSKSNKPLLYRNLFRGNAKVQCSAGHNYSTIIDRRRVSITEKTYLKPSLVGYGNGMVSRVLNFKVINPQIAETIFRDDHVLRQAILRVQKAQPLIRSRIVQEQSEFYFEMMENDDLPNVPIVNLNNLITSEMSLNEYVEREILPKPFDLKDDFQMVIYYYLNEDVATLIVRYNHCICDGLSISFFLSQLLQECENVFFEKPSQQKEITMFLPSSDEVIEQTSIYSSWSEKLRSISCAFPMIFNLIRNKVNTTLIEGKNDIKDRTMKHQIVEFNGDLTEKFREFTRRHGMTQNALLLSLLSHAYLRVALQKNNQGSRHLRIGYPVGLSLIPGLDKILDGSTMTVHVGTMIRELNIKAVSEQDWIQSIMENSKEIRKNQDYHFVNQFILMNILTSPANRETAMLKTIEKSEISFGGIDVNIVCTNNGKVDVLKRSLFNRSLILDRMYTTAMTSSMGGAITCGIVTLPSEGDVESKLVLSLSCVEPIISKKSLSAICDQFQQLFTSLLQT